MLLLIDLVRLRVTLVVDQRDSYTLTSIHKTNNCLMKRTTQEVLRAVFELSKIPKGSCGA